MIPGDRTQSHTQGQRQPDRWGEQVAQGVQVCLTIFSLLFSTLPSSFHQPHSDLRLTERVSDSRTCTQPCLRERGRENVWVSALKEARKSGTKSTTCVCVCLVSPAEAAADRSRTGICMTSFPSILSSSGPSRVSLQPMARGVSMPACRCPCRCHRLRLLLSHWHLARASCSC